MCLFCKRNEKTRRTTHQKHDTWPTCYSYYCRAFRLRYSPRPHIQLFAHRHTVLLTRAHAQDNRVVPEPDTVGKACSWLTLTILAKQDCILLQTCLFRGLPRGNRVLCRYQWLGVVKALCCCSRSWGCCCSGSTQRGCWSCPVFGVVGPRTAAKTTSRQTKSSRIPLPSSCEQQPR